jgi:hypothetical protein
MVQVRKTKSAARAALLRGEMKGMRAGANCWPYRAKEDKS